MWSKDLALGKTCRVISCDDYQQSQTFPQNFSNPLASSQRSNQKKREEVGYTILEIYPVWHIPSTSPQEQIAGIEYPNISGLKRGEIKANKRRLKLTSLRRTYQLHPDDRCGCRAGLACVGIFGPRTREPTPAGTTPLQLADF